MCTHKFDAPMAILNLTHSFLNKLKLRLMNLFYLSIALIELIQITRKNRSIISSLKKKLIFWLIYLIRAISLVNPSHLKLAGRTRFF